MKYPDKLSKGDKVTFVTASSGLVNLFPHIGKLGEERVRKVFDLEPINVDLSKEISMSTEDRVASIHKAFEDNNIKAIFAYIGGIDQLSLIKYLDHDLIKSNPKAFFGFSDNTHLHLLLNRLGIVSYYGGSVMTQLAMQGSMDQYTINSLKSALFSESEEWMEVKPSKEFNEIGYDWSDKTKLDTKREYEDNPRNFWYTSNKKDMIKGQLWGGCLESLQMALTADIGIPDNLKGKILFFETSEEIPPPEFSRRFLYSIGVRGWLNQFGAVLVGRPKSWEFNKPYNKEERDKYKADCREVIETEIRKFNKDIPIIQNMDFGHTDPQVIVPSGGECKIDPKSQQIWFKY